MKKNLTPKASGEWMSLTLANPFTLPERKKLKTESRERFEELLIGRVEPFSRQDLQDHFRNKYPDFESWSEDKIRLTMKTQKKDYSTYGDNAVDFGYNEFNQKYPNLIEMRNGKYRRVGVTYPDEK